MRGHSQWDPEKAPNLGSDSDCARFRGCTLSERTRSQPFAGTEWRSTRLRDLHVGIERAAEGSGRDASWGNQSVLVDVGAVSVPAGRSVLSEDESGVCGFDLGDLRTAAGGGTKRDPAAGDGAGSGGVVAEPGAARGDADGAGAIAVAGVAGSCSGSGATSSEVEAVVVQWRSVVGGFGAAISDGVSGREVAEHLRIVGGGGGCDLARGGGRRHDHSSDWQADQQQPGIS